MNIISRRSVIGTDQMIWILSRMYLPVRQGQPRATRSSSKRSYCFGSTSPSLFIPSTLESSARAEYIIFLDHNWSKKAFGPNLKKPDLPYSSNCCESQHK